MVYLGIPRVSSGPRNLLAGPFLAGSPSTHQWSGSHIRITLLWSARVVSLFEFKLRLTIFFVGFIPGERNGSKGSISTDPSFLIRLGINIEMFPNFGGQAYHFLYE